MKRFLAFVFALIFAISALASCGVSETAKTPSETEKEPEKKVYEIIGAIIGKNSYYVDDLTDEDIARALVEAYAEKAGDRYAKYYSAEEYRSLLEGSAGEKVGIGIIVIENTEYDCIEVIGTVPDTPADSAGLEAGDFIVTVGKGDDAEKVSSLGYELAKKKLAGDEGTVCDFGIVRDGNFDEIIEFSVERKKYTYDSVMYEVCAADTSVGIVKIREFNLTTPVQFKNAVNSLLDAGCERFVFDVRNNSGGSLNAVSAMISYFANPEDILFRRVDRNGNMTTNYCKAVTYGGEDEGCSVAEEELGMFRKYENVTLVNEYTASAAELFAAALSDYGLTATVGVTTYGKGSTQTVYDLSNYGDFAGAVKVTTRYYYPPTSDNYNGIGITPDEVVEPDETMKSYNLYKMLLPEFQQYDNQLSAAVELLKK